MKKRVSISAWAALILVVALSAIYVRSAFFGGRDFRPLMQKALLVGEDGFSPAGKWIKENISFSRPISPPEANLYGRTVVMAVMGAPDRIASVVQTEAGEGVLVESAQLGRRVVFEGGNLVGFTGSQETRIVFGLKDKEGGMVYMGCANGVGSPEEVLKERCSKGHFLLDQYPGLQAEVIAVQSQPILKK